MTAMNDETLWQALLDRDNAKTGAVVYSVASSGIYCRIGCPSRPPLRRNVRFYATATRAEDAGFRACKRCKPNGPAP